jgi:hypothetical protein
VTESRRHLAIPEATQWSDAGYYSAVLLSLLANPPLPDLRSILIKTITFEAKVMVYNYAKVALAVLAKAERRAEVIFEGSHVRVVWVDSDFKKQFQEYPNSEKDQEELNSIEVTLRIIPHSRVVLKGSALGEALPCQLGKDACVANIFMNRVAE